MEYSLIGLHSILAPRSHFTLFSFFIFLFFLRLEHEDASEVNQEFMLEEEGDASVNCDKQSEKISSR